MTPAQQLSISERAHEVYRVLFWEPRERKGVLSIAKACEKYPLRGGQLDIGEQEMTGLLHELQEASLLLALTDTTTGARKYCRTDSGRKAWLQAHSN